MGRGLFGLAWLARFDWIPGVPRTLGAAVCFVSVRAARLLVAMSAATVAFCSASKAEFAQFITRSGDRLYEGDARFHFVGYNVPAATGSKDSGDFRQLDEWELEDLLVTCEQMGVTVVRLMILPVAPVSYAYITGVRTYSDEAFRRLDRFLQLAEKHNVRVIVPFLEGHVVSFASKPGICEFAGFRGKTAEEFFTDATLRQDFKDLVLDVVHRRNCYTGKLYKDDKTILAWQTGNEMDISPSWSASWEVEMCSYVKSLDPNHLTMSGAHQEPRPSRALLESEDVDLVGVHAYSYWHRPLKIYVDRYIQDCRGRKPFIVDEFDDENPENIRSILEEIPRNPHFSGALQWSLRGRTSQGGFFQHKEAGGESWYSYNWPGSATGEASNCEITKTSMIREFAFRVRGMEPAELAVPTAPVILATSTRSALRFKGATGAVRYEIQRGSTAVGPWATLTTSFSDFGQPYPHGVRIPYVPFNDESAPPGTVFYRVRGFNREGKPGSYSETMAVGKAAN